MRLKIGRDLDRVVVDVVVMAVPLSAWATLQRGSLVECLFDVLFYRLSPLLLLVLWRRADGSRIAGSLLEESSALVSALESTQIPSLAARLKEFRARTTEEALTASSLASVLSNQERLLEILEIPSLMETCVKSERYDAALELKGFVEKMRVLHGGRTGYSTSRGAIQNGRSERGTGNAQKGVLEMIEMDVRRVVASMTEQLFGQLEREVSLTACLQIVGTLKRVVGRDGEVGFELRRAFLERRGRWVDGCVGELCSESPVEYIRGLTDVYRLQVADVLMQYRTIFFGARGVVGGVGGGEGGDRGGMAASTEVACTNLPVNDPSFAWGTSRMMYYLEQVEETLPQITDGSSLASVLESCSYAGRALARVGCDPRGALLFGMIEDSAVRVFCGLLEVAEDTFEEMVGVHRWVAIPVGKADGALGSGDELASVTPPMVLVEHTPLAVYTNGVLAALNELRQCCPVEVHRRVEARLLQSIDLVERTMANAERPRGVEELKVYKKAAGDLRDVMAPFLKDCLRRLF